MTVGLKFDYSVMRSSQDEARFFAAMGYFFASADVRRECGGYPLNDGPLYHWYVAQFEGQRRVAGFVSVECTDTMLHWREGYVHASARGHGLFRQLRQRVLEYADQHELVCRTRVREVTVPRFRAYGFKIRSVRGRWTTLEREPHVR